MAFIISTTDGAVYQSAEVGHLDDGSIAIIVEGNRKLRLSAHYWTVIEGAVDR